MVYVFRFLIEIILMNKRYLVKCLDRFLVLYYTENLFEYYTFGNNFWKLGL